MFTLILSAIVLFIPACMIADIVNDFCNAVLYPSTPPVITVPQLPTPLIPQPLLPTLKIATFTSIESQLLSKLNEGEYTDNLLEIPYTQIARDRIQQSISQSQYTIPQLKDIAACLGIKCKSKLKKAQLETLVAISL